MKTSFSWKTVAGTLIKSYLFWGSVLILAVVVSLLIQGQNNQRVYAENIELANQSIELGDLDKARGHIESATAAGSGQELSETRSAFQELLAARVNYNNGMDALRTGKYLEAIDFFHQVTSADSKNFESCQALISESQEAYLSNEFSKADASFGEGDYQEAISLLREIPEELRSDEVSSTELEYRTVELSKLFEEKKYVSVLTKIDEALDSGFSPEDFESLESEAKSLYVSQALEESGSLMRENELSALLEAQSLIDDSIELVGEIDPLISQRETISAAVIQKKQDIAAEEEKEQRSALRAMRVNKDDFENIKFIYDSATYSQYAGNKFLLYIAQRGDSTPSLRLKFMLYADSWHFFERIKVNVDGTIYSFEPGYLDVKRDNYLDVWEWWDTSPNSYQLGMVRQIIDSNSARIRYINGDDFYVERTITSSQKRALERVLDAYAALNNGWTISAG